MEVNSQLYGANVMLHIGKRSLVPLNALRKGILYSWICRGYRGTYVSMKLAERSVSHNKQALATLAWFLGVELSRDQNINSFLYPTCVRPLILHGVAWLLNKQWHKCLHLLVTEYVALDGYQVPISPSLPLSPVTRFTKK